MSTTKKRLVLIDGNAVMHRAYHALPLSLTTSRGEPINAVYGFVSMLLRVVSDLEPTHIAVCFDRKEPTFRKKEFKEYQAHRPEMDEELSSQFGRVQKVLVAMGVYEYSRAGYEADDVIGTIAKEATYGEGADEVDEVVIVTGDKDILQLVNSKVKVYLPKRGLADAKLMDVRLVREKMGVEPGQIVDFKGLAGDPSDNYPGVVGIGPKTAEGLIEKYGTVENIYKHLDEVGGGVADKLRRGRKDAKISKKLAKIVTDVDVEIDLSKLSSWKVDGNKVLDLFAEYGFRSLTNRVKKLGKEFEKSKQMSLV